MAPLRPFHPDFLGRVAERIGLRRYEGCRQFVVQHLYPDTLRLLTLSHRFVPIDVVIGISYSGRSEVVRALRDMGIRVLTPDHARLGVTVEEELGRSLARAGAEGHRLLLHEVGGHAIDAFHRRFPELRRRVVGAVEITKQGVWTARQLPELLVPQLNCAETRLKEIEGSQVGEAVVLALDVVLRELGYALTGRAALVTGYGWVGRGVCLGLRNRGMTVFAADPDPIRRVAAAVDGFLVRGLDALLPLVSVVIGAAGVQSVDRTLLDRLPDRTVIASGSSKDVEIDLAHLRGGAVERARIHPHVEACRMADGRTLYLVGGGFPVNFLGSSVPDEIVEFLFGEALILLHELLEREYAPGTHPLSPELERIAAEVWLEER